MRKSLLGNIVYFMVLISLSILILDVFLLPSEKHYGINRYNRGRFLDMVDGTAPKPFVYRTLLPTTVRAAAAVVPIRYREACANFAEQHMVIRAAFRSFEWETQAAFQYLCGATVMLLCFIGFGHFTVKLTERVCGLADTDLNRLLLVAGALAGLPPFFRYASYAYDPAQLLLFTLALYFLAERRMRAFFITFVACCLNKETAVLLIPAFGLTCRHLYSSHRRYWGTIAALVVTYTSIKAGLTWVFFDNPGTFVEVTLARNAGFFAGGWTFTELGVFLSLAALLTFRWNEKPAFLRLSFLSVFLPLAIVAMYVGWVDEWRVYYEAYPVAFGLMIHSVYRFNDLHRRKAAEADQPGIA
jgi:hypothetical protein